MAKLTTPFSITGPLAGLSFYHRKDLPGTFVRGQSRISKERMHADPAFANTRRSGTEGGGRSQAAKWIRRVLKPLEAVRDHNWQGALSGSLTALQKRDIESAYGERSVLLSQHGYLLEGYPLSRRTPWDTMVRTPLSYTVDREHQSARVEIPALLEGVTFFPRTAHPYFRLVATLGVVPDLHYAAEGYGPAYRVGKHLPQVARTEWLGVKRGAPATALELQLPYSIEFPAYALVLALGVLFGSPDEWGEIREVGYSGSGRLAVVR
jgi:hypothetical protein